VETESCELMSFEADAAVGGGGSGLLTVRGEGEDVCAGLARNDLGGILDNMDRS
jgi:hypothetical protein